MTRRPLTSPTGQPKLLDPVHPNVGIEMEYRRRLQALVDAMHLSLSWWIIAAYRANEPEMLAEDAMSPANALRQRIARLGREWMKRFDAAAPALGEWFAKTTTRRSDAALKTILRNGGISVKFQMTRAANDVMRATIGEQVGLIKSIAQQHLTQVEGMVMRSVAQGRDVGMLTKDLQDAYGVSFRRAAFIARDQNNKATATINRVRQTELGITKAVWLHSGGGNHPRPEHVGWDGKTYDVAKGMWSKVDGAWVYPGTAINCRCVSKSIVPGYAP